MQDVRVPLGAERGNRGLEGVPRRPRSQRSVGRVVRLLAGAALALLGCGNEPPSAVLNQLAGQESDSDSDGFHSTHSSDSGHGDADGRGHGSRRGRGAREQLGERRLGAGGPERGGLGRAEQPGPSILDDSYSNVGLPQGTVKRMKGDVHRAAEALASEVQVYEAAWLDEYSLRKKAPVHSDILVNTARVKNDSPIDLLEGMVGAALCTWRAPRHGLVAAEPCDLEYGWDLSTRSGMISWNAAVDRGRPLVIVFGFDCRNWCRFNSFINFRGREHVLEQRREKDRQLLRPIVASLVRQARAGRFFVFENPRGSQIFDDRVFQPIWKLDGAVTGVADMCAHGKTATDGVTPLNKHMKFVANSAELLDAILVECPGKAAHPVHAKVQGGETRSSASYPAGFADALLSAVRRLAKHRDSLRFRRTNDGPRDSNVAEVLYIDMNRDTEQWLEVVQAADEFMVGRAHPSGEVPPTHRLYQMVQERVPRHLQRVQIYRTPKARRRPTDITYTHRACLLVPAQDGVPFELESDEMENVGFPRMPFARPVRLGVFVYGDAPPDPPRAAEPAPADADPDSDVDDAGFQIPKCRKRGIAHSDELWFQDVSEQQCPRDVRSMVARLHMNLSHPSKPDLMKHLLMCGAKSATLAAANALKCAACDRRKAAVRLKPSKIPRVGQFNETIQFDIVTVAAFDGQAWKFLGLVDMATVYHVADVVHSRDPAVIYALLQSLWLLPFGAPDRAICDIDGAFQGDCQAGLSSLGVVVDMVPASAHHQLGTIERHNALFRLMMDKVVDSTQAVTDEQMRQCCVAVCSARNSLIRRCGRSPNQAVFGRTPKLPGGLLTSETAPLASTGPRSRRCWTSPRGPASRPCAHSTR